MEIVKHHSDSERDGQRATESRFLADARTLNAGELEAVFLPSRGMLGASLQHRGIELLGRLDDLEAAAAKGSTAGIPLLHPWANRLEGSQYRAAGRDVTLDPSSPLLHWDGNGLPIHGVGWPLLPWQVTEAQSDRLVAQLEWTRNDLLAVFPFPHRLEMRVRLDASGLTLETSLVAIGEMPVPVSFGFHPYFVIAQRPRAQWRLTLPTMRKLTLDARGIPTGEETPFLGFDAPLGEAIFDDGFAVLDERTALSIEGAERRISVELLSGYRYAQVFAPRGKNYVALEPMTAPTNALVSGRGLNFVQPGSRYTAVFRISVSV